MLRLAITRTSEQLAMLSERAEERGVAIVPLPVIAARPIPFAWPEHLSANTVDWVFFSSSNGVTAFFSRLRELKIKLGEDTRFAAVGKKTAQALEDLGYKADFVPSDAYGQLLFEEFAESIARRGDTIIYSRGADVNFDPADLFAEHGLQYVGVVCYQTTHQPVDTETVAQLTSSDYILFTAPSAVTAYQEQFGRPVAKPIAIGRSTANRMNQFGWFGFITMNNADIDTILEYL